MKFSSNYTDLTYLKSFGPSSKIMLKEMIKIFLEQTPLQIEEMKRCIEEKNWHTFANLAHKLKPSFVALGIVAVDEVKKIELYSRTRQNIEEIPYLFDQICEVTEGAVSELKFEFENL